MRSKEAADGVSDGPAGGLQRACWSWEQLPSNWGCRHQRCEPTVNLPMLATSRQVSDVGLEAALTTRAIETRGERIVKRLDCRELLCLGGCCELFERGP